CATPRLHCSRPPPPPAATLFPYTTLFRSPTFSDLCDELANWRSADRLQGTVAERSIDEAQFAALKLRDWTGEKGTYSKLFDRHRSEEHTSELQSLRHLVCRLLLEKKEANR